jgi:lysophospholipase L1-like esterase
MLLNTLEEVNKVGKTAIRKNNKDIRKKPAPKKTISKKEKTLFNLVFVFLIILAFVAIEIALRLTGYGIDTRVFIKPRYRNDIYVMNVNFANKYFPRQIFIKSAPLRDMMIINQMSAKKSPRTLRGFVIGESSAQGYPYKANQSFGKITEAALAATGKYEKVEIMNLGVSAISSYCIKDIAKKLLPYQPDFLVVYAGHNEYYGTISATTGGNYFTKNLYVSLKESRLFQLLFNLNIALNPASNSKGATIMEEQFNQQKLPLDPKLDQEVAANFIKNIDGIVQAYARRKIPVIIMEPVCNLYDMPPFSGEKDDLFKEFIEKYAQAVKSQDHQQVAAFYQARLSQKQYGQNANVRYLDALAQRIITGKPDLESYKLAKDLDTTPFRAKENLLENLRNYCQEDSRRKSNVYYIPLSQIMAEMNDPEVFGNKVFIDQLHFTQAGQRLMSQILTGRIARIFQFDTQEQQKIAGFYGDDARIDQAIRYLPGYRIEAHLKVRELIENAPFTQMLLPYQRQEVDGFTIAAEDPELVKIITGTGAPNIEPFEVANYYFKQEKIIEGKMYLDAYQWTYPGCYRPYLIQARFSKTFTDDLDGTFANYMTAYLLSDKMKMIYDEAGAYLTEQGREDLFQEFKKYGKPE